MNDAWSKAVKKPEKGRVHLSDLRPGEWAVLWDGREVVVESVNGSGVTVSEVNVREVDGKQIKSRTRMVIARATNVVRKP